MDLFNLLPMYKVGIGELTDGYFIKAAEFCKKHYTSKKCDDYYRHLFGSKEGLHVCPYGFNIYTLRTNEGPDVFTSLRIQDRYDPKKVNPKIEKTDNGNWVINEDQLKSFIISYRSYMEYRNNYNCLKGFIDNTFHDIRKFNAHIKNKSIFIRNKAQGKRKLLAFENFGKNIWVMSSYISTRLDSYNLIYNPFRYGDVTSYNLFHTFDKIRRCLTDELKEKELYINLDSNKECSDIKAYDSIELVPFLLIDNSMKYCLRKTSINIYIEDTLSNQKVILKCIGPQLVEGEIYKIFDRGFRGKNAQIVEAEGSGIGLYIVNEVCKLHDIRIDIKSSEDVFKVKDGVNYSSFEVILYVPKNAEESLKAMRITS